MKLPVGCFQDLPIGPADCDLEASFSRENPKLACHAAATVRKPANSSGGQHHFEKIENRDEVALLVQEIATDDDWIRRPRRLTPIQREGVET